MNFAGMGLGRRISEGGNEDDDGGGDQDSSEERRWIRWLIETADRGIGDHEIDDMVIGLTTYDEKAQPQPGVESVLIPNRSKNQYIRQTTSNGRKCVFQLDAYAAAKNGTAADGKKKGQDDRTIVGEDGKEEDRLKWIEGKTGNTVSGHVACFCSHVIFLHRFRRCLIKSKLSCRHECFLRSHPVRLGQSLS